MPMSRSGTGRMFLKKKENSLKEKKDNINVFVDYFKSKLKLHLLVCPSLFAAVILRAQLFL